MRAIHFCSAAVFVCSAFGQGGFSGPGRYEIGNIKSGKVLDLDRNDRTTVIQFSSRGTDNQQWFIQQADSGFYFIRNAMNGDALTAVGDQNATPVQGVRFTGDPAQQWAVEPGKDGNALIRSRVNGKALDVPDGTSRDGVRIQIFDANGDSNQRFTFRQLSGARFGRPGWMGGDQLGGPGIGMTCASDDGRRHYCNMDTGGGVTLRRQISGSPCIEGQTWGFDGRGVWVDRGCRAEFQAGGGGGGGYRDGGYRDDRTRDYRNRDDRSGGQVGIVRCASDDGRRHYCDVDTRGGVRLTRQISGSPCNQDQTWGFDNRGIWVDRGCRAEFQVGSGDRRR